MGNTTSRDSSSLPRGISRRPDGRLLVQRMVQGVRQSKVIGSLEDAILVYQQMGQGEGNKGRTTPTPPPRHTPAKGNWTLGDAYLCVTQLPVGRGHDGGWKGAKSEAKLKRNAEEVMAWFGESRLITEIGPLDIDAYASHLASIGRSAGTVNRKLAALSKLLSIASSRGMLTHLPHISRPAEPGGRERELSYPEEATLLDWLTRLEKPGHHDAVVVLLDTGMRVGELLKLRGSDVDLRSGVLVLRDRKAGNTTGLPMADRVREIITRRRQVYGLDRLFPYAPDWLHNQWSRVRHLMGMDADPCWVPHILRHTCCSRLVRAGIPLTHVMTWMGHKSITTTQRYAHLMPGDLMSAARILDLARAQGTESP